MLHTCASNVVGFDDALFYLARLRSRLSSSLAEVELPQSNPSQPNSEKLRNQASVDRALSIKTAFALTSIMSPKRQARVLVLSDYPDSDIEYLPPSISWRWHHWQTSDLTWWRFLAFGRGRISTTLADRHKRPFPSHPNRRGHSALGESTKHSHLSLESGYLNELYPYSLVQLPDILGHLEASVCAILAGRPHGPYQGMLTSCLATCFGLCLRFEGDVRSGAANQAGE